ncbi:hypothetical protein [Bacillus benzoevorans]|uniref:Uncharacterized protein n=1 Tax=Bacillus benzoevorans TaxID=1456 RepID=A0A7X0LU23_9BACI|nr:hypothetical protein [Bacillus benzoevorans]MBB6444103.1 hypothetical protein [Bacillus benzoevorans]
MGFKQEIEFYGEDLQDFEMSPFETIEAFHKRTVLHQHYHELTPEEKTLLKEKDQFLLEMAESIYEHLKQIYDFQIDKPFEEWWWHLDKVANRQFTIDLEQGNVVQQSFLSTIVEFKSKEAYDLFLDWSRDKQIVIREKKNEDQKII